MRNEFDASDLVLSVTITSAIFIGIIFFYIYQFGLKRDCIAKGGVYVHEICFAKGVIQE